MSCGIGRIVGRPVRIHYTLCLAFLLLAWSLAESYIPRQFPELTQTTDWAIGITSALVLFISVLIHELSHSYIATKNGLKITKITLFFFGGVSEMSEEPTDPNLEIRIAASGPITSLLIAGILQLLWYVGILTKGPVVFSATLECAAIINGVLGVFNLVPASALDGGRVLRGLLWKYGGTQTDAVKKATRVSEIISFLIMSTGIAVVILADLVSGLWIVFLGWFIRSAAGTGTKVDVGSLKSL